MDFRTVQKITVPQGDVLKIEDSGGNPIWRKRLFPAVDTIPPSGGIVEITPLSGNTVRYGDHVTLHAVPSEGYQFHKFGFDGNEIAENDTDVGPILSDVIISAFFVETELTSTRK